MTPQEIDRIECAIQHIKTAVDVGPWVVEIAVEAMKKQIPMKTIDQELGIYPWHPIIMSCGNCGMELADRMQEYCPWCGQAIDWEDE